MTLTDILPAFEQYLRHERRAAQSTIQAYLSDVRRLGQSLNKPIGEIGLDDLRTYQRALSEQGLKSRTIERKFASFATLWHWFRLQGWAQDNIVDLIYIPKRPRRLPRWLDSAQLRTFITTEDTTRYHKLRPRNQLAWLMMGTLALRRGEVLNLMIDDVQLVDKLLIIRNTKGGADRSLPLPDVLIEPLTKAIERREGYVMPGERGGKWAAARFARSFTAHVKRCGLPKWVTPHTIRHSVATHWAMSGISIFTIQKLMGHVDIKTTMVYLHALPQDAVYATSRHVLNVQDA